MRPERVVRWRCPACRELYASVEQARACIADAESEGEPRLAVGDVVVGPRMYGWNDGDAAWVAERAPGRRGVEERSFYYVVAAVDRHRDGHSWRYHCRTLAMTEGSGYGAGWTGRDHLRVRRVDPADVPPAVRAGVDELVALGPTESLL